jgi:arsenate reductase-like glutaredoxin family protein
MFNFNYLIEKINKVNFIFEPFKHIYIENFLSQEHFDKIINSSEIKSIKAKNDKATTKKKIDLTELKLAIKRLKSLI